MNKEMTLTWKGISEGKKFYHFLPLKKILLIRKEIAKSKRIKKTFSE